MEEKMKIDYDEEFDDLFIYKNDGRKSYKFTIAIAGIVVDIAETGKVVGIEIMDAKKTISDISDIKNINDFLKDIKSAKIYSVAKRDGILIKIMLVSKHSNATIPLAVPSVSMR